MVRMKYLIFILLLSKMTDLYCQKDVRIVNRTDTLTSISKKAEMAVPDSTVSNGTVVVRIIVDRDGNVLSAEPVAEKSTLNDSVILKAARDAALKAKFTINPNASPKQTGYITYKFKLTDEN